MSELFSSSEYKQLLSRDGKTVTPAVYRYTSIAFERGEGVYLYDIIGNRYLDFASGMAALPLGHCHPRVVSAIKYQAKRLHHLFNHIGYYAPYTDLIEKLQSIMPEGLHEGMAILMNSGSEAVESALKVARFVTGRPVVISFMNAFHGRTLGALSVTSSKVIYRKHQNAFLNGVYYAPYPFGYRFLGKKVSEEDASSMCRAFLNDLLANMVAPEEIAAIIVEPIQGEGGYRVPSDDFLPYLRDLADGMGSLLITDEIQTGMGRTGRMFAFEHWGVVPDLVVLAKAFGGGLPLSAVYGKNEVMGKWEPGAQGSTFGGNPIAIAAARATIEVILEEGLVQNSEKIGGVMMEKLKEIGARKSCVGDVRGKGLLIGMELIDENGEPDPVLAKRVCDRSAENGLVITTCGTSTLRFAAPLVINEKEAEKGINIISAVLDELAD